MKHAKTLKRLYIANSCSLRKLEVLYSFYTGGARSFIVFRQHFLPLAERLQAEGHKVVFVGSTFLGINAGVPSVFGDQEQGDYLAVKHLLDLGHRRIAFHFPDYYKCVRRWRGGHRAIEGGKDNGFDVQEELLDWSIVSEWKQQSHEVKY